MSRVESVSLVEDTECSGFVLPVVALDKFKIRICQGVPGGTKTPFLAVFAYFFRFFAFFFSFPHWNHVIFGLQLVYSILVHMCTVFALEKFKIRVCQGVSGGTKTLL